LWPLNPNGDLLAIVMIESVEALQNIDAIVSTPGIGAIFVGNANDLTRSMGVRRGAPEVEEALQKILHSCKAHGVACGISANTANAVVKRVKEGWNMIRSTQPAITEAQLLL
jgi:4-hydroxy-2-oxoheptanedioate aldolase